jgi:RNA polymerase sigma factor (sigma-70 family)
MVAVDRYVPLAKKLAWQAAVRYRQRDFDAVLSDALLGLVLAAKRCDSEATFEGYARTYIKGHITNGIRDRSGIRWFRDTGVQEPPPRISLDALEAGVADLALGPVEVAERSEVWRLVDGLPEDERAAVRGYYQLDLSQAEIAALRGVNQMAVSRSLARARRRLRARLTNF